MEQASRRRFLAVAGGIAVGSSAGGVLAAETASGSTDVPQPRVAFDTLYENGWTHAGESTRTVLQKAYLGVTVTARARTITFENEELASTVDQRGKGVVPGPLSIFSATRIGIDPDLDGLPGGVGRAEVLSGVETRAVDRVRKRLRQAGVGDVGVTDERTIEVAGGATGALTGLRGKLTYEGRTVDLASGVTAEVPAGSVPVDGWIAVWNRDGTTFLAAGTAPAENVVETVTGQHPGGETFSTEFDLDLDPQEQRAEVLGLMQSVH